VSVSYHGRVHLAGCLKTHSLMSYSCSLGVSESFWLHLSGFGSTCLNQHWQSRRSFEMDLQDFCAFDDVSFMLCLVNSTYQLYFLTNFYGFKHFCFNQIAADLYDAYCLFTFMLPYDHGSAGDDETRLHFGSAAAVDASHFRRRSHFVSCFVELNCFVVLSNREIAFVGYTCS